MSDNSILSDLCHAYFSGAYKLNVDDVSIGVIIEDARSKKRKKYSKKIGKGNKDIAEYKACLTAIEIAKELGYKKIWLYTHCAEIDDYLKSKESWKCKDEVLRPLIEKILEELESVEYKCQWVKKSNFNEIIKLAESVLKNVYYKR